MAGDTLLGRAKKLDRPKPLVQRRVAVLKDRADAHGELLAASSALFQPESLDTFGVLLAWLGSDALQIVDALVGSAVRADRAIGPEDRLLAL